MHSLPIFVRLNGRAVILIGDGEAAAAKRALLERAGAIIVDEPHQATLAIVAIDDDAVAEAAIKRLKSRGILVNAVDRATLCDFTLPAIVDRDPVIIAIGTGGASAGLAKALRQRLETLLPTSLGLLATAMFENRDVIRARWPDAAERRRAIDAAFDPGGALDPVADQSFAAVDKWIGSPSASQPRQLIRFAVPSDDPDDLTLRQARWLGRADTIVYHPKVAPAIVARGRADAVRHASTECPDQRNSGLTLYLERG